MKKINQNGNPVSHGAFDKELQESPFLTPEGYFSTLKAQILLKKTIIDTEESSFLVPPDYQDSLKEAILASVSEMKLKEVFETDELPLPEGYFDQLQNRILDKTIRVHKEIPVKKLTTHSWFSYAAAACIAFAIALFSILNWDNFDSRTAANKQATIEDLPTQEIINYLAYYTEPEDLLYLSEQLPAISTDFADDLSTKEIEAYLENSL